jgi:hypothetical protein
MIVACTNCQEELAEVKALSPCNVAFTCGKCGWTGGQKLEPEPVPVEQEGEMAPDLKPGIRPL